MTAVAYSLVVLTGLLVLAFMRLRVDLWWVAFFSAAIYALPLAFSTDIFGRPISAEASLIMTGVLIVLLLLAVRTRNLVGEPPEFPRASVNLVYVSLLTSLAIFLALIWTYGFSIFFVHKLESGINDYFYILWRLSATLALLLAILSRRYKIAIISVVPILGTVLAGDRTTLGLSLVAVMWLLLQERRVRGPQMGLAVGSFVALGIFIFFGKIFQAMWSQGILSSMQDLIAEVLVSGRLAIIQTEPFAVIGVLSALTTLNAGPDDFLVLEMLGQILVVPSAFGFESASFNEFFQPLLFPEFRSKSLAYSFWGEAYVRGGWFGVAFFVLFFAAGLWVFDRLTRTGSLGIRAMAYVGGAYWAFYIHRNSMISMLAYERHIWLFGLGLMLTVWALGLSRRRVTW